MMDQPNRDAEPAFGPDGALDFGPVEGPLDCAATRDRLPLHVGGDLEPEQARAVDAHLVACAACRALGAGAERMRQTYFELAAGEPPVDLWPGVRVGLVADGRIAARPTRPALEPVEAAVEPGPPVAVEPSSGPRWRAWIGGVGLAAAALLAVGLWRLGAAEPAARGELAGGPTIEAAPAASGTSASSPVAEALADAGAIEGASTPLEGGLRTIPASERLLHGARPVLLLQPASGGPESLASGIDYQ